MKQSEGSSQLHEASQEIQDPPPALAVPEAGPSKFLRKSPSIERQPPPKQSESSRPAVGLSKPEPKVQLSPEQRHVLDLVKRGRNVFFTGSAGTGKSVLLREIIKFCRQAHGNQGWGRLGVTASTGIASVNIGGCTLHSWAGIGLGKEDRDVLVSKVLGPDWKEQLQEEYEFDDPEQPRRKTGAGKGKLAANRWTETRTLIIDEISMIDGHLFDKLEYMARAIRGNGAPFGGIQLVLSGDFLQLPPVPDENRVALYAFQARSWERCVGKPVSLQKVFRQKDQVFIDILNIVRYGKEYLTPEINAKLRGLSREVHYDDGIEPTDLFPTRKEVEARNNFRLQKIDAEPHEFQATDMPGYDEKGRPVTRERMYRLLGQINAQKTITLKVGAQVMLIKNVVQGQLVNGSVGKVIDFLTPLEASREGISLSEDILEHRSISEPGNGRKGFGNRVRYYPERDGPETSGSRSRRWPVVRFQAGETMLCMEEYFDVNNAEGKVEATRSQIPLILAWALSVHKSQGQTLDRVRVHLGRTFENGQAYVALSRATSMDRLQVVDFDPGRVRADKTVINWMREQTDQRAQDRIDEDIEFWSEDIDQ